MDLAADCDFFVGVVVLFSNLIYRVIKRKTGGVNLRYDRKTEYAGGPRGSGNFSLLFLCFLNNASVQQGQTEPTLL